MFTPDIDAQINKRQKQLQILKAAKENPLMANLMKQNYLLKEEIQKLKKSQPIYGTCSSWQSYSTGAVVNVKYPHLGLTKTPLIFTSLHGTSSIWMVTGMTSIYSANKDGFSVFVNGLSKDDLIKYQTVLHYQLIRQQ